MRIYGAEGLVGQLGLLVRISFVFHFVGVTTQSGFDIARKLLISIFRMIKHPFEENQSVETRELAKRFTPSKMSTNLHSI